MAWLIQLLSFPSFPEQLLSLSHLHIIMGRSLCYKSPATIRRNLYRLVKYLSRKLSSKTSIQPSLSIAKSSMDIFPNKPELSISPAKFTNYPGPCSACDQHQCQYNFFHKLTFRLSIAVHDAMEKACAKKPKPPDRH